MFWKYFCLTKNGAAFQRVFQYCSVPEPCRLLVPDLVEKAIFSPMEFPTEASNLVGEGVELNPAAAEIRRAVDAPLVLAQVEGRIKAGASAHHAQRDVLGSP